MVARQIVLATEDELSEAVGMRLVTDAAPGYEVGLRLRKGGYGYLRSRFKNFCQMARRQPVLLITDLDRSPCAATLITTWSGRIPRGEGLLFRVAVREIESWLLADHEAMRSLLGSSKMRLPEHPDTLSDPKHTLLDLAKNAPRHVRTSLRADVGAIAAQGLGYNQTLVDLIQRKWSPSRASSRSDSLRRACRRLNELANA